jgi:hypothetical protein
MIEFFMPPILERVGLFLVLVAPLWAMLWWFNRRTAADRRRWELQRQVWDMGWDEFTLSSNP